MTVDARSARHPGDPESPIRGRAVIDVANVCRERAIPVPGRSGGFHEADRLRLVVGQWRRLHGADADLRFVTDHSLRDDFSWEGALADWHEMVREFAIEGQVKADGHILDYADAERRFVISKDLFRDFRRRLPWIERQPDRFLRVTVAGQSLRFRPSGIKPEPDYLITNAEEKSELRDFDYVKDGRSSWRLKWLETRWRCRNRRCRSAQSEYREPLPPRRGPGDEPRCRHCDGPLDNLGPRAPWCEVKVMNAARTELWGRFVVEAGPATEVGRGRADHGVSLDTIVSDEDAQGRISRQHVKLAVDSARALSVVDLESSNGTVVHDSTRQSVTLAPHEWREVLDHGWIVLGGTVCLVPSAREYLRSATAPLERSSDDRVTQL
jgi:FHA domain